MAGLVRIGCSGWSYPHWRGLFYPKKMPELNNSFYRQPPRVKASRYITHIKRKAVEQKSIDLVVESAEGLGTRLGPFLFQFQANFKLDMARLEAFLPMLPARHRHTLEFRHESWLIPPVFDLLRRHRVALCIPDHPTMPPSLETTSDFTYVRFHLGPRGIGYGKTALETWAQRVRAWRDAGLDVFLYYNNDMEGYAIKNAETLTELLNG